MTVLLSMQDCRHSAQTFLAMENSLLSGAVFYFGGIYTFIEPNLQSHYVHV